MADKLQLQVILEAFDKATGPIRKIGQSSKDLAKAVKAAKTELKALEAAQKAAGDAGGKLGAQIAQVKNRLTQQQAALAKVNTRMRESARIHSEFSKAMAMRQRIQGAGIGMVGAGVAAGAATLNPVIEFSRAESAQAQLQAALMDKAGKIGPEFDQLNALAISLGNRLPGTTQQMLEMFTQSIRQGMTAQKILGGLGEATAYLAVQLKMPYEAAAEFSAKLQEATRTTENDMMGLLDTIQRTYYLGVDANNMLEGFKKVSPLLSIIKQEGLQAANTLAPMLVMLDQAGMRGESAGNALRKVFQRAIMKGDKGSFDVLTPGGEFAGMDKLFSELAKLRHLNTKEGLDMINAIFGDDAETQEVLNVLIDKGRDGYLEVAAKLQAQASLQQRVNIQLGTLANLWEAASGTFTNFMVSLGESVAPEIKRLTVWLGEAAARMQSWAAAHPQMAAALLKATAAIGALLVAGGALLIMLAAFIGPLAALKFGFGWLAIAVGTFRNILIGVINDTFFIARMAMAHPLIALAVAIAAAAVYIWANWSTLGPKFKALWDGIRGFIVSHWTSILQILTGFPARFIAIGISMMDGLRQGIEQRIAAVKARIAELAAGIAGSVRQALGIHSPSSVFAEIGRQAMAGLHQGITVSPYRPIVASGAGGSSMSVSINIQAAPGQSERGIGEQVAYHLDRLHQRQASGRRARLSDYD